jgi:hypothetical protein
MALTMLAAAWISCAVSMMISSLQIKLQLRHLSQFTRRRW